jgi:hypothetical protein
LLPNAFSVQLNHNIERLLGSYLTWILHHGEHEVLEFIVEILVFMFFVDVCDICMLLKVWNG